ncbi:MAG: Hpt domain-containing protein [Pelatocladus maniniholoensis HA4357-MV3]|jgi:chemotaxis protein histidine kinase CheA|uniref:Hpt domain-containing protein n=1 Tax=Pelatocladus maniniholoensis HA4357-MV3 TaxID=1117104 RepID=A0A9E3LVL4_9NOST|nr:Hpt domain-containing protein [Pelatocladus maniniholoensis HA4357-MV3]
MLKNRELENQTKFLEEANGNLNTLESIFLQLNSQCQSYSPTIDLALQKIHFIKAGAELLGFPLLSNFAHRLEDALQILKKQTNFLEIDSELHSLLLSGVEWLRQIVELLSVGYVMDEQWLVSFCFPVFEELKKHVSEQNLANNKTQHPPYNELEDIIVLIFQTEVEEYLQHLKSLLAKIDKSNLKSEVIIIATQLDDLGELLNLKAFTQLCRSVIQHLKESASYADVTEIAQLALLTWQRSQTLILTRQFEQLPTEIVTNSDKKVNIFEEFTVSESLFQNDNVKTSKK